MAGTKNDIGKLRMDLIPLEAEEALATVLTHGAKKYGDHNWRGGIQYHRIYGAMRRHLLAWAKRAAGSWAWSAISRLATCSSTG